MSMSEFERQSNPRGEHFSSRSTTGHELPPDFNEVDLAFAEELESLFAVADEEIAPYFVQTILEPEDPRFQPVEHGFEQKTMARVFRRLKMKRCLFHSQHFSLNTAISSISAIKIRRSFVALAAAVMLFMFLTVMFTAPTFASGMAILLKGARTGAYQVKDFPKNVASAPHSKAKQNAPVTQLQHMSLSAAQQLLHFSMYLPKSMPVNYTLDDIYLYQETDQSWADGPLLEFDYYYLAPGVTTHGSGEIAIREFKLQPKASVYQVVGFGAAHPIQADQSGEAQAIYIDGQWVMRNRFLPVWIFGGRSELIYQKDGIIFWIVGDQHDGIDQNALMKIATSLQILNVNQIVHTVDPLNVVTQLPGDTTELFTGDVLAVFPDEAVDGSYLRLVGSDFPLPEKHTQKGVSHSH